MPKLIQTPGPGQALVQTFGLKGRFQPVLDETIVPVVLVESTVIPQPAQCLAPTIPAAAGEHSFLNIVNAASSRVNIVVQGFAMSTADILLYSFLNWSLVGSTLVTVVPAWRNTGLAGLPSAAVIAGSQATASMPAASYFYRAAGADFIRVNLGEWEATLAPGTEFTLWGLTANTAWTRAGLLWQEIPINPTFL